VRIAHWASASRLSLDTQGFNLRLILSSSARLASQTELLRSEQLTNATPLTINSMKEAWLRPTWSGALVKPAAAQIYKMEGASLATSGEWAQHHGL
jgi:hypothetical protein